VGIFREYSSELDNRKDAKYPFISPLPVLPNDATVLKSKIKFNLSGEVFHPPL
jgi:hypothetical protein